MKKILSYLLSLLLHLLAFVLCYLLFFLRLGVDTLGHGGLYMTFLLILFILALFYVTIRWAARLRCPLVSVVLLVLSLLMLASGIAVEKYKEEQLFCYTPQTADAANDDTAALFHITPHLRVFVESMQVRKRGGVDQPSLMLQIHRGKRVQSAFLTRHSWLEAGFYRLDLRSYQRDDQGRITQVWLRAQPLYGDYLARAGVFGLLACLLLLLATYLLSRRVWVVLSGLSLTLGSALLIASYSEHEVLEEAEFQETPTGAWLPNHRPCADSLVAVNETDAMHPLPAFTSFEVNASDKFTRRTCVLRVGERVRVHNSFLMHTGVMGRPGECLITCRYAHWPYLSAATFMLNLGLCLLVCAHYRAEMLRRHMAEKCESKS